MQKRAIELISVIFGALWLAAICVQFLFVAQLLSIVWMIGALVAQIAVFLVFGALLLVTNTRRPYGIDPNAAQHRQREADRAFASPTADLFRQRVKVQLPDGNAYGGRKDDDPEVVQRLLSAIAPQPQPMPDWAQALRPKDTSDEVVRPSMLDLGLDIPERGDDES